MPSQATSTPTPLAGSISESFVAIIRLIEDLQVSKRCEPEQDFGRSQVRLDTCKLRLTRLGIALGVLVDPETGSQRKFYCSPEKVAKGRGYFEMLLEDMTAIERRSKKRAAEEGKEAGKEAIADDDEVYDVAELEEPMKALHKTADGIVSKRLQWERGSVSGGREQGREPWPVYEKHHFESVVGEISTTAGYVEDLFPDLIEPQKLLVTREVKELQQAAFNKTALVTLEEASKANRDTMLAGEVRSAIAARGSGHRFGRTEIESKAVVMQGDYIARGFVGQAPFGRVGHYYGTTIVEGGARLRQGDSYGGEDM